MEQKISAAVAKEGWTIVRAHAYDEQTKHGFIWNQRMGMDVFNAIPTGARVIIAEAVWQYSYHLLAGVRDHKGHILTVANWSGEWPGLVGLLNMNASLQKMGRAYSSLWSENFDDEFFLSGLRSWLADGSIKQQLSYKKAFDRPSVPAADSALGKKLAEELRHKKAIMGIFDEGCMGMFNAIFDDELLARAGIFKERLSQSALLFGMKCVTDEEAHAVYEWVKAKGMQFKYGKDEATELTERQVIEQCRMYIAAARIAADYSCDVIGIQYQQGLKDMCPASDLAEGLLNCIDRPPIFARDDKTKELFKGQPVPHFNEVDQGCAVDTLVTNRACNALNIDPSTSLHDIRWGQTYEGDGEHKGKFVWVMEISGSVPPNHIRGGYKGCVSERQPPMYFPLGGGTIKGVSKAGPVVWSRVFQMNSALHVDIGIADAIDLPDEETQRRWNATTPQWPIMHAVLRGVSRDQLMAGHYSNHIQVVYAPTEAEAQKLMNVKACMFDSMGIHVNVCGV